jgi:hypothetical protein
MAEPRPAPSTKPVAEKLLLKAGMRALVLNAPAGYLEQFPEGVQVEQQAGEAGYDFIQLFATRRDELLSLGPKLRQALNPNGLLWVSYPKGKGLRTDLNRDVVRLAAAEVGLQTVSQVAIDDVWSALRNKVVEPAH